MYRPKEVIFAPTGRCNLHCGHCRVDRGRGELDTGAALAFLSECADSGIERVGFSGGEPFLRPDFLEALVAAAVGKGMLFDRLMTNGDWWRSPEDLGEGLSRLAEAGFDGTLGLSVDDWHGQDPVRLAAFLGAWFEAAGRKDGVELVAVSDAAGVPPLGRLRDLATLLGGRLETAEAVGRLLPVAIRGEADEAARASGEALDLRVVSFGLSRPAAEGAWQAPAWFKDDRCEGPGQALYVHPDGSVAVCCGFANERPELCLGRIDQGLPALLEAARSRPLVLACYGEGLSAVRERLEREGVTFPGMTDDQCFFCDWLCDRRLGPAGEIR